MRVYMGVGVRGMRVRGCVLVRLYMFSCVCVQCVHVCVCVLCVCACVVYVPFVHVCVWCCIRQWNGDWGVLVKRGEKGVLEMGTEERREIPRL